MAKFAVCSTLDKAVAISLLGPGDGKDQVTSLFCWLGLCHTGKGYCVGASCGQGCNLPQAMLRSCRCHDLMQCTQWLAAEIDAHCACIVANDIVQGIDQLSLSAQGRSYRWPCRAQTRART